MIHIELIGQNRDLYIDVLLKVWEDSVSATHHFLKAVQIIGLRPTVAVCVREIPSLYIAFDGEKAVGFMGIDAKKLEMLFLAPEYFGQGIGRKFLDRALEIHHIQYIDVNEQNFSAAEFYEHCGFKVSGRSEFDSQGNPFPILHLRCGRR